MTEFFDGQSVDFTGNSVTYGAYYMYDVVVTDYIGVWCETFPEVGVNPWLSFRMNDVHNYNDAGPATSKSEFWYNNPQYRRVQHHSYVDYMDKAYLGVDIGYTITGDIFGVRTKIQELVMTGDDTYQLFLTHCIAGLSAMITEDLLYDFRDFEYVDLGAEWWNQQSQEALDVNGHLYYGVSDYMLSDPKTVQNADMVGKVIELLSYFSGDTVRYAYYEIMLGEKLTRDPDSKEMLDIIFDGVSYNAGVNYFGFDSNMKKFFYIGGAIWEGGANRLASYIASYKPGCEAAIEQFNVDVTTINTVE